MSVLICATVTNNNVPVNGLADDPEITIRRADTQAIVAGPSGMTDQTSGGNYTFLFTPSVADLAYVFEIDADPLASGQVTANERYFGGCFDDKVDEIWRDRGLDPVNNKTITENTPDTDYTELESGDGATITKSVVKAGAVTTIDRS